MLKKPVESQISKSRPASRTPARPTHIRTNSQTQAGTTGRRRKDTNEDSYPSAAATAAESGLPPAIPPRTSGAAASAASASARPSSSAKPPEHSFLTDVADVREMEKGLLSLLDDFHSGKLQAFGSDDAFKKMDAVREQQEQLARMHFRLDQDATSDQNPEDVAAGGGRGAPGGGANSAASKASSGISDENMDSLLTKLHALSHAIQDLHPEASFSQTTTPMTTNSSNVDHSNDGDGL